MIPSKMKVLYTLESFLLQKGQTATSRVFDTLLIGWDIFSPKIVMRASPIFLMESPCLRACFRNLGGFIDFCARDSVQDISYLDQEVPLVTSVPPIRWAIREMGEKICNRFYHPALQEHCNRPSSELPVVT
jgi:hypothetical protein